MAIQAQKKAALRGQLWELLQYGKGTRGQVLSYLVIVMILLSVAIIPLEFIESRSLLFDALVGLEIAITAVFTIEYLLRLYASPSRFRYVVSFFGIIDLLSILPFYLGLFASQYIRVLRLTRLVRLLKISRIEAAAAVNKEQAREVGLIPGERVIHVVTRHPFIFMLGLLPVAILLSIALTIMLIFEGYPIAIAIAVTMMLFALIFLLKAFLDYNFDVIYVTSHRLIFQNRHLLGRNMNQVNYRSITNVKPQYTGIFSYILGYGSIIIETPAEFGGKIEQSYVRRHEESAHHIMHHCICAQEGGGEKV